MSREIPRSLSPDTQAVGPRHRRTVPQQEAAILSEHFQQLLCVLAPNPAVVNGANEWTLPLHVASEAGSVLFLCVWLLKVQQTAAQRRVKDFDTGKGFHTFLLCKCKPPL